jgi:hypothetical protein
MQADYHLSANQKYPMMRLANPTHALTPYLLNRVEDACWKLAFLKIQYKREQKSDKYG